MELILAGAVLLFLYGLGKWLWHKIRHYDYVIIDGVRYDIDIRGDRTK